MFDILKRDYKNKNLTAIYTNRGDYDKFSVGYILAVNEDDILIKHLNSRGEFDGYSVRKTDSVYRIENDGMYLDKIKRLSLFKHEQDDDRLPSNDKNEDILFESIKYALDNKLMVIICLDEEADDIVGYIIEFADGYITVLQVSEFGHSNGKTVFPLQEIIKISINDIECRDIDILYQNDNKA